MRIKNILTVSVLAALMLVWACDKKVGKEKITAAPVVQINACDTITYVKHIKPIIDSKCISCHAQSTTGPDFRTYSAVKSRAVSGALKLRAIDPPEGSGSLMPQGGPKLAAAQLQLIQCWINNGQIEQ